MSRNRLPPPSASSSQRPSAGLPSVPRPPSVSTSQTEPPQRPSSPPTTYADPSGPRRPTRSVRRPNGQQHPTSEPYPQSSSSARSDHDSRGSPETERKKSIWDEDRLERERATEARLRSDTRTDAEVFKAAQVGQAFASAVKERKAKEVSESGNDKKRGQQLDGDELDDLDDPTGEFGTINGRSRASSFCLMLHA